MTRTATAFLVVCAAALVQAQAARTYAGRLATVPMDGSMVATVAGSGSMTATLSGSSLTIDGKFAGLKSPATVARLHLGKRGIRGPAVADLTVSPAMAGTVSGKVDLTPSQVAVVQSGGAYVQIHSEKAPDGNLWGWLLPPDGRR